MIKYSTITGTLNNIGDRYMSCGYKKDYTYQEILDKLGELELLDGVELSYSTEGGIESNKDELLPLLGKYNMTPSFVNSSLFGEQKWALGSLSSPNNSIRQNAIEDCKKALDYTREVSAAGFNLWTGQDGFDYPLQTDYQQQWNDFLSSLSELCEYAPDINITLEPKLREPRLRSLIDTVPTALLVCKELGYNNLGLTVDVGHTLQAGGNMARDLDMALKDDKLFNIHINDNYSAWDDDMIVGSVHMIEFIEMMYILQKNKYDGWVSVDIFPFRENQFEAVSESILYLQSFAKVVDKIGLSMISSLIKEGTPTQMLKTVRETLFG